MAYNLGTDTNTQQGHASGLGGVAQDLGITSSYQANGPNAFAYNNYASQQQNNQQNDRASAAAAQNTAGPQITNPYQQQSQAQLAGAQNDFGQVQSRLQAMYNNPYDSMAQHQFQQGLDQSIGAQMAVANSARGGALAQNAARRNAMMQGGQARAAATAQAAQLADQDQFAALNASAGVAGQQGNLGLGQYNLEQHNAQQQAADQLAQEQVNNQLTGEYLGSSNNEAANTLGGLNGYTTGVNQTQAINAKTDAGAGDAGDSLFKSATDAAGKGLGVLLSDPKLKKGMRMDPSVVDAFLEHVDPKTFRYRQRRHEPTVSPTGGTYLGVSADDVESAPIVGHQIVKQTDEGKALDNGPALSAALASVGHLHRRLKKLEGR